MLLERSKLPLDAPLKGDPNDVMLSYHPVKARPLVGEYCSLAQKPMASFEAGSDCFGETRDEADDHGSFQALGIDIVQIVETLNVQ